MDSEKDQVTTETGETEEQTTQAGAAEDMEWDEQAQQAAVAQMMQMFTAFQQMDVYQLLAYFSGILEARAWTWMGIRMDPITNEVNKDLEQAKTAIDAIMFIVDKIAPKLQEPERREMRHMLSNLQMNFVTQSSKGE